MHCCSVQTAEDNVSDHCSMNTCFLLRKCCTLKNVDIRSNIRLVNHKCRRKFFKWMPEKTSDYVCALHNNGDARHRFEATISEQNVLMAYHVLCSMIHAAADAAAMAKTTLCQAYQQKHASKTKVPDAPWLDGLCDHAKRSFMVAFRKGRATRSMKQTCKELIRKTNQTFFKTQAKLFLRNVMCNLLH